MDRPANNGDGVRSPTMSSTGCEQRLPHFSWKTRGEKRSEKEKIGEKKSISRPSLPLVVTPAFSFFFHIFGKRSNYAAHFCFLPPSFQSSFHTGENDSSSFFFPFFFVPFSVSVLRWCPYERSTHGCQRPFGFVRKRFLSSVIFFGVTDNNMAYNRIGIMPVALQSSWHEVENFIMTHCSLLTSVCRARSRALWCINWCIN